MSRSLSIGIFVVTCSAAANVGCLAREVPAQAPVAEPAPPQEPVFVSYLTLVERNRAVASDAAAIAALRASDGYRTRRYPAVFRLGAGYGAVGRIELASCRELGLDPGYVRMRVTFGVDGAVSSAVVESPTRPPREALGCIGRRLEEIAVPVFEGGDVTLSKSLYLAGGPSGGGGGSLDSEGKRQGFGRVTVAP
jgi:hypothetical protein